MRILHLSADYPDPLAPGKTRAIRNLLTLAPEAEHRVWSLNRVGWRRGIHALPFDDEAGRAHRAVAYGAPPRGVLLAWFLNRLADWIAEDADRAGFRPDAIHAHKLSVEGLVAERLAAALGAPVLVSLQGDSDLKIVGAKRDLRARYRRIWREAAIALPFAPWTATRMAALLGPRDGPVTLLPCPAAAEEPTPPPRLAGPVFRSAFHLASADRKNAHALIRAVGAAARRRPEIRLEILGGGDPDAFARLAATARAAAPGRVAFLGPTPGDAVPALLNGACAHALVSRRESYGMASAEALLAGTPCLLSQGWGLDGCLPDGEATLSVPAGDEAAIADALLRLAAEERAFKDRLAALAARGALDFLKRAEIGRTYRGVLAATASSARETTDD